jgi:hypothetical protein
MRVIFWVAIAIYLLLFSTDNGVYGQTVLDTILSGYDVGTSPTGTLPIKVDHQFSITSFVKIEELKMSFDLIIIERLIWTSAALAYQDNNLIDAQYKEGFVNMNPAISKVWIPRTQITSVAKSQYRDESWVLYPNGTLDYMAYRYITIACKMNLEMLPFDYHDCPFTMYVGNENTDTVILNEITPTTDTILEASEDYEIVNQFRLYTSLFSLTLATPTINNMHFEYSNETHSGTKYVVSLDRNPGFFLISYLIPALLIIFLSYAAFWLDRMSIPARVSIGITPILITVNLMARANANTPNVSYMTWQATFFIGILSFTSFGMIEYGITNFCNTFYVARRKEINDTINKLK